MRAGTMRNVRSMIKLQGVSIPSVIAGLHVQDLFMKIIFGLQDGRRRATAAKCPVGIDFDPGLRGVLATMVGEPPEGRSRQNGP